MLIEVNGIQHDVTVKPVSNERLRRREARVRRQFAKGRITATDARATLTQVFEDAARLALGRLGLYPEVAGYSVVTVRRPDGAAFEGAAYAVVGNEFKAEKGLQIALGRALDAAGVDDAGRARFRAAIDAAMTERRRLSRYGKESTS